MKTLFEPCSIGNMELRNRFVRSATWEGMATEQGEVTDDLVELYRDLGKGGVGLVISGYIYVDLRGKCSHGMLGLERDSLMPGLKRLTAAVREEGGRIVAQIVHGGAQMEVDGPQGVDGPLPPEAPSAVADQSSGKIPVELSKDDIARVVKHFADTALRAKECGFDAAQLHAAHGYLLSQFLSPYSNVRTDEYGGSIENRARAIFETYDAVRAKVGQDYPVMIKINAEDFDGVGLTAEDSLWVCEQLATRGIDAIELSGGTAAAEDKGTARSKITKPEQEAYFREHAKRLASRVACPIILVGGVRSLDVMEEIYNDGAAQFFSMSRPFISEPDLVNRWLSGDTAKARCVSCNRCFKTAHEPGTMYCAAFAKSDGLDKTDI